MEDPTVKTFRVHFNPFFGPFRCQDGDDDDEDWAEETTEEAQRRRMEEISDHAKNLTLSEDLEKPLEERVNLFYNFVKVRIQFLVFIHNVLFYLFFIPLKVY